jgi:hypothetical protein
MHNDDRERHGLSRQNQVVKAFPGVLTSFGSRAPSPETPVFVDSSIHRKPDEAQEAPWSQDEVRRLAVKLFPIKGIKQE